jgi:hypothetical protein
MRHNCSWNYISNILSFFRSVNLKEMSHKNIIDKKTSGLYTGGSKRYTELLVNKKLRKQHCIIEVNLDSAPEYLPEMPLQCTPPDH